MGKFRWYRGCLFALSRETGPGRFFTREMERTETMEPVIKARTDYDFAHLVDLQRIGAQTGSRQWMLFRRGIILAAAAACAFLGVTIVTSTNGNMSQAVIYFLLAAVLGGMFFFFHHYSAWRIKRKIGKKKVQDEFTFGDYGVDITRGAESVRYPYSDCDNLLETELAFYLFHHRGKGLVISKSQIEGGTPDDLRALLEDKCQIKTRWVGRNTKS